MYFHIIKEFDNILNIKLNKLYDSTNDYIFFTLVLKNRDDKKIYKNG